MRFRPPHQLPYFLLLMFWVFALAGRFWANGIAFNLDYGIYQPDGAHYAYRALTFLGQSSDQAATQVVDWYRNYGFKNNTFTPYDLQPQNIGTWAIVSPRILYPLLSVPFVALLGIKGMLVIPALALLVVIWASFLLGKKYVSTGFGLLLAFSISISPTILRWVPANLTDGLLYATFAITTYVLVKNKQDRKTFLALAVLVISSSLTRFCFPVWAAIAFVLMFNRQRRLGIFTFTFALACFIPTLLSAPDTALLPNSEGTGLLSTISSLAISFFKVGFIELAQLAVLDRGLLMALLLSTLLSIFFLREMASKYFLGVLLAVWFIGAINGTLGVNFRYQLPLLPFAVWVISLGFGKLGSRFLGDAIHVIRSKA
jgi:hypothetical protein